MNRGPDFLGIGAQRAGSTWMHQVLSRHPQLWLTPVKELHHFDDPTNKRWWYHLRKRMRQRGFPTAWDFRYFLGGRGDKWYANLFAAAQARGKIAGEITPSYAILDEATFGRIRSMNPKVKFIFSMREPVSRAWSSFRNMTTKGKDGGRDWPLDKIVKYGMREHVLARSRYVETIRLLESLFPPDQIHYCFFDDIKADPVGYGRGILEFLGVDSSIASTLLPPGAVNASTGNVPPPPEFVRAVAEATLPSIEELCLRFEGPPHVWRDKLRAVVSAPATS